jgi:hypothetical protein
LFLTDFSFSGSKSCKSLTLKKRELTWLAIPLFTVGWAITNFSDVWPDFGQFGIKLNELFLISWNFIFRENRIGGTFGFAQCAIDALVWVNHQKVRAFVEAVDRAHFHAVLVFALNAVFSNDKCHVLSLWAHFNGDKFTARASRWQLSARLRAAVSMHKSVRGQHEG